MNIKIAIAIKHNNRSEPCKPSLYITRINELYTSAEPVSFCKTIKPAGIANNKPINARLEKRMILKRKADAASKRHQLASFRVFLRLGLLFPVRFSGAIVKACQVFHLIFSLFLFQYLLYWCESHICRRLLCRAHRHPPYWFE